MPCAAAHPEAEIDIVMVTTAGTQAGCLTSTLMALRPSGPGAWLLRGARLRSHGPTRGAGPKPSPSRCPRPPTYTLRLPLVQKDNEHQRTSTKAPPTGIALRWSPYSSLLTPDQTKPSTNHQPS
jgi:hypothetical protein